MLTTDEQACYSFLDKSLFFPEFKYKEVSCFHWRSEGKNDALWMTLDWALRNTFHNKVRFFCLLSGFLFATEKTLQGPNFSADTFDILTPPFLYIHGEIKYFSMNASTQHLTLNVFMVFSFMKVLRFVWSFLTLSAPPSWRK